MNPTKTLACSAAVLCFAAGAALAGDPSREEQDTVLLLEPVEAHALYGVDEDGDGLADYLVLEDPDLVALFGDEEEDAATGAF